jgi:hypothetical protein
MLDYIGSMVFATGKPSGFRASLPGTRRTIICALALVLLLGTATFAILSLGEIGAALREIFQAR